MNNEIPCILAVTRFPYEISCFSASWDFMIFRFGISCFFWPLWDFFVIFHAFCCTNFLRDWLMRFRAFWPLRDDFMRFHAFGPHEFSWNFLMSFHAFLPQMRFPYRFFMLIYDFRMRFHAYLLYNYLMRLPNETSCFFAVVRCGVHALSCIVMLWER